MQVPPTGSTPTTPITVEGVLLGLLALLGYVVVPKLLEALTTFVRNRVEGDKERRQVEMTVLKDTLDQNKILFQEVQDRGDLIEKMGETNAALGKTNGELAQTIIDQRNQFAQEREGFREEIQQLRDEVFSLNTEVGNLRTRLAVYETGENKPV
jgi:gas vesicle protein